VHFHYATPASLKRYLGRFRAQIKPNLVLRPKFDIFPLMTTPAQTGKPGLIGIEQTATKESLATPWNVIVHNDPINLMSYVTMVFQRVFGYPRQKAERLMLEVHTRGRALVWSGGREQAEHYVHQLHSYQLLATMEKSEA
jgi:ATP-dependent Clp protease adaptor protein ClpS